MEKPIQKLLHYRRKNMFRNINMYYKKKGIPVTIADFSYYTYKISYEGTFTSLHYKDRNSFNNYEYLTIKQNLMSFAKDVIEFRHSNCPVPKTDDIVRYNKVFNWIIQYAQYRVRKALG